VGEHAGGHEVTPVADDLAAHQVFGTGFGAGLEVARYPLQLLGADQGAQFGVGVEAMAQAHVAGTLDQAVDHLVVDLAVDQHPRTGGTDLA
jgi:hypothetical protein